MNVNIVGVTTIDELYVGTSGSYSVIPVEVTNTVDVKGSVICRIVMALTKPHILGGLKSYLSDLGISKSNE